MEIQILPLIIVVAYLVGMLTVGAVVSKVQIKNAKDYMVEIGRASCRERV